ncbi:MAG TPA: FAD-linked oxidase C-terminal domain-containing protein [Dehalococcoidia bacterium]|nr:FAD-linked oxidase C-terminal domain-containing protein [Dehalococcoidia bacterium]
MKAHPLHETVSRARDLSEADRRALRADLRAGLLGDVRTERAYRLLYATDASIYQMEPAAVVFPDNAEDVRHVVEVAARAGVPILPRGGGTSLAGQAVNHAIVLDFTPRMRRVLEVNRDEGWALVEPGVVLAELNRAVAPYGLHYPIDPSTANRATIGGGIGNNSCGAHSVIYGKTSDQVLSLDLLLVDGSRVTWGQEPPANAGGLEGRILAELARIGREQREEVERRFPKIMRRVSGYNLDAITGSGPPDLPHLIVGSEGTLAVITAAKVKLAPLPAARALAAVHFETIEQAAEATLAALEHGPAAVELVDDVIIRRCRAHSSLWRLAGYVQGDPGAVLLIEFFGSSEAEALSRAGSMSAAFEKRRLGYATVITTDPARQRDMWRMREAGLGLIMSVRGDAKPVAFVEDTAVAPEKLPAFVQRFKEIVAGHGLEAAYYGHASVGCLHIRPMVDLKTREGLAVAEAVATEVADLVLEFGGSLSGEHGDGIVRGVFTERMFGPRLTEAFRELKRAFDPRGILNPGKIVDTPGFSENLRVGPALRPWEPATYLDFSAEGGIARAAEQCNGQGACRKLDGTMCPSYMVTLDEEHSTRGRANLLRLAMSGVLPPSELTGDAIHEALDLCVECKACRAECPSGVDLAKLKYEVLAQRLRARGVPLRSRLFAEIAALSAAASRVAPLANALARLRPGRLLLHRLLGIHSARPLPRFAPRRFEAALRRYRRTAPPATGVRGDVVLFVDTFTRYFHPEAGIAAVRLLEAVGYRAVVAEGVGCCGRPAISKGLLPRAGRMARRNVDLLAPYVERGLSVVGIEPSCLLTFRDEYPDLLRDDASRLLASRAMLVDELLMKAAEGGPSLRALFAGAGEVLLHTHCHQKAGPGSEATLGALRLAGYDARLIDSGCCGMAGSFGFEAEHYEVSRAMGAYRLFPVLEAAAPDAQVAVTGVSCRQQVSHFTSRRPRHAVELLADALAPRHPPA